MAMNFWEAQKRARSRSRIYIFVFILLTLFVAFLVEIAIRALVVDYTAPFPLFGIGFAVVTIGVACYEYSNYLIGGGRYVVSLMDGYQILPGTKSLEEKALLNIVEEVAIAASLPVPEIYIIEGNEINAFTAGTKPDNTVIAITRGAMNKLNRDEIQGVVAHEFGHIYNKDVKTSMRLAALVMGFFIVFILGLRFLQFSGRGRDRKNSNLIVVAFVLLAAGAITWFFGSVLKACVSREREYLADACSVQFTRNPDGLVQALYKIKNDQAHDMPKEGMAFAHLYLEDKSFASSLFATHPSIDKRIAALQGAIYAQDVWLEERKDS